jgi:hypothetical protein
VPIDPAERAAEQPDAIAFPAPRTCHRGWPAPRLVRG